MDRIDLVCQVEPVPPLRAGGRPGRAPRALRRGARAGGRGARAPARPPGRHGRAVQRRHGRARSRAVRCRSTRALRGAAARRSRSHPAERARPRPRAAGGAHDRRPRRTRARRARATWTRRSPTGSTAGSGWRRDRQPAHACLRRGASWSAHLAPRIAGLLGGRDAERPGCSRFRRRSCSLPRPASERSGAASFLDDFDAGGRAGARSTRAASRRSARHAPAYPPLLRELSDPPAVLFAAGRAETFAVLRDEPSVAIVGTRRPSPYGTEVALRARPRARRRRRAGRERPGARHRRDRPPRLPRRARRAGGGAGLRPGRAPTRAATAGCTSASARRALVLSELPPGTQPFRWSFPARNRIMAALARLTLVVEAADPSGSLITADFAQRPGPCGGGGAGPGHARMARRAPTACCSDGAAPITGTDDVLDELFGVGVRRARRARAAHAAPRRPAAAAPCSTPSRRGSAVEAIARATGRSAARDPRRARPPGGRRATWSRRDLGGWERAAC